MRTTVRKMARVRNSQSSLVMDRPLCALGQHMLCILVTSPLMMIVQTARRIMHNIASVSLVFSFSSISCYYVRS
jgi:hypothetical protein